MGTSPINDGAGSRISRFSIGGANLNSNVENSFGGKPNQQGFINESVGIDWDWTGFCNSSWRIWMIQLSVPIKQMKQLNELYMSPVKFRSFPYLYILFSAPVVRSKAFFSASAKMSSSTTRCWTSSGKWSTRCGARHCWTAMQRYWGPCRSSVRKRLGVGWGNALFIMWLKHVETIIDNKLPIWEWLKIPHVKMFIIGLTTYGFCWMILFGDGDIHVYIYNYYIYLAGGFKHFIFSIIYGIILPID